MRISPEIVFVTYDDRRCENSSALVDTYTNERRRNRHR